MLEGLAKRLAFRSLQWLGVLAHWERRSGRSAGRVPILAYHGVSAAAAGGLGNRRRLHVPCALFEEHLRHLATRWRPLALSDAVRALRQGGPPAKAIVVTFDDGYKNLLTVALPLLQRYGVPATVFVLTGTTADRDGARLWIDDLEAAVDATDAPALEWDGRTWSLGSVAAKREALAALARRLAALGEGRAAAVASIVARLGGPASGPDDDRDLLTWDDVAALQGAGLEIGSHAPVHEPLTSRRAELLRTELADSRAQLDGRLGPAWRALAYPYGAYNGDVVDAARAAGFDCALTTDAGLNTRAEDPFRLKRLLVGADDDLPRLRASMTGLRAALAPRGAPAPA